MADPTEIEAPTGMEPLQPLSREASERLQLRRRARNWALLIVLVALVLLFYAISVVKMGRA